MAVTDYSTTPSANTSISGINIAEDCPAANVNNAIRTMMADIRVFYDGAPVASNFVAKTGGVFTGNPRFDTRGGYLYHDSSANLSGRIFIQAAGGSAPSGMADGDLLLEY